MAEPTPLVRWSRIGAMVFTWLFTAGIVIQVFLAGLALFDTAERWDTHESFGMMIGILPLLALVFVLLGRTGRQITGMAVVMVILYVVQVNLPELDASWIAALHPLVAFALLGMSGQLGARIRSLVAAPSPQAMPGMRRADGLADHRSTGFE